MFSPKNARLDGGIPKGVVVVVVGGGGSDIRDELPNNPVFFLRTSLAVLSQNLCCRNLRCSVVKPIWLQFTHFHSGENWAQNFVSGEKYTNITYAHLSIIFITPNIIICPCFHDVLSNSNFCYIVMNNSTFSNTATATSWKETKPLPWSWSKILLCKTTGSNLIHFPCSSMLLLCTHSFTLFSYSVHHQNI